ncbi:MAG: hypothetical protein PHQ96_04960 [Candidatus Omnitrophica bacterium]|nr:hypothetical protein [Candidatus Omnitrophota bacterium]
MSLLIIITSAALGFILVANPALAIELQKKFYVTINWKIEPISMQKELRNTRIMGLFLLAAALITLVIYLFLAFK